MARDEPAQAVTARLAGMRRAYHARPLDERDLAGDWCAQFERWLADAVAAGLAEPNAMVLATASPDARPSARVVLLKSVDRRGFAFYTNLESVKGRELRANPRAALVFPWIELSRQVVAGGAVEPVPEAEADAYFASRPRGSQLSALASPQSRVVASRAALDALREDAARRHPEPAAIPRPASWGGVRVVPDAVEFWQGRADRFHDRLRYRLEAGRWLVERLAP